MINLVPCLYLIVVNEAVPQNPFFPVSKLLLIFYENKKKIVHKFIFIGHVYAVHTYYYSYYIHILDIQSAKREEK